MLSQPALSLPLALRNRPLVWLAPSLVLGCAMGGLIALAPGTHVTRASSQLLLPVAIAVFALHLAWRWRHIRSANSCVATAIAVAALGTSYTAYRMAPPSHDISELVNPAFVKLKSGPQRRPVKTLRGVVVGHPRRRDFKVEFVLRCTAPRRGNVWVKAPLDSPVTEGATVEINAELSDLPRAGNHGERSPHLRYVVESCWAVAEAKDADAISVQHYIPRSWLTRQLTQLRAGILHDYAADFARRGAPYPEAMAQLLTAMVFGDGALQEPLPRLTRDEFRVAGLSHLLVASGTQVSLFALILLGGARLFGLRRWWIIGAVLPALLLYVLMTGGEVSIWRAAIGGICLCLAILLGRDIDGLSLWSLALITLLLVDPAQLYGLGFQLTFAATWGLIVLAPPLTRGLARFLGESSITRLLALSLGAQLATIPLLLYYFGQLSTVGLGANLIGAPLAGVLVATGMLGLVVPPINQLNYSLTETIASIATLAARAPGAQLETVPLPFNAAVVGYAAIIAMVMIAGTMAVGEYASLAMREVVLVWWKRRVWPARPQALAPFVLIFFIANTLWRLYFVGEPMLRVTVLDVGQGESILIESPAGRNVLIDGGTFATAERGDVGRSVIVPYLRSRGIRRLDAVVVTHADADHVNALPHVLREVPVDMLLDGGATSVGSDETEPAEEADYQNLLTVIRQQAIPRREPRAGQRLNLGGGAILTVLSPFEPLLPSGNNNSLVLRLDYGKTSVLLTGDIEKEAEERLVRRGANLRCTVLKVAHHGSSSSTTPTLMRAASPSAAVISCGRYNQFGHPTPQTLRQLDRARVPVLRTDVSGAVEIRSDGERCWFQTFR